MVLTAVAGATAMASREAAGERREAVTLELASWAVETAVAVVATAVVVRVCHLCTRSRRHLG